MEANEKFNTCTWRSRTEISRIIQRCSCQGGNYEIKSHFCNKRQIFDVTPEICANCELYQKINE